MRFRTGDCVHVPVPIYDDVIANIVPFFVTIVIVFVNLVVVDVLGPELFNFLRILVLNFGRVKIETLDNRQASTQHLEIKFGL